MKQALLWACLVLPVLQWAKEPLFIWVPFCLASLVILKKKAWLAIGVSVLTFFPIALESWITKLPENRIVELNDKSVIVATSQGKILVMVEDVTLYHLLDTVTIEAYTGFQNSPTSFGFDPKAYQRANRLIGMAQEDQLTVLCHQPLVSFIDSGAYNRDPRFVSLMRSVLFQSDPQSSFISLISMGLIYALILKCGKTILAFGMKETTAGLIMSLFLIGWAILFAYPLSLMRVIVTSICGITFKNRKTRLIVTISFFQLWNPAALTSLTILMPLGLMILSTFQVDDFERFTGMAFLQIILMKKTAVLRVIAYRSLRRLMAGLIGLIWIALWTSHINPMIFFLVDLMIKATTFIDSLLVIRGHLSIPLGMAFGLIAVLIQLGVKKPIVRALTLCVLCGTSFLSSPWAYQVTFISVGQGDATVLQAPFNQEVILIDTGKPSAYGQVRSFLDAQGIHTISSMILTHDDQDHSGSALTIQKEYAVDQIVTQAQDLSSRWFDLKSFKTTLPDQSDNQASLIYGFRVNKINFLLMADADEKSEIDVIRQFPDLKTDILKIGHHGSSTSTSDALLSTVKARMAIISVGYNSYGHPSMSVLERLNAYRVKTLLTRQEGDITVILSKLGNFIRLSSMKLKTGRLPF